MASILHVIKVDIPATILCNKIEKRKHATYSNATLINYYLLHI